MRYLIILLLFISVNAFGQSKIDSTKIKDSLIQVEGRKFVAEYFKGALTDFDKWAYSSNLLSAKDYNEKFTQWMGAYLQEVYKGYLEKKTKK